MKKVKSFGIQTIILFILLIAVISYFSSVMGVANFFSTAMKTAHDLLLNTVFFITAISVLAGALGSFLAEFGIIAFLNWILAPIIHLFWRLPGAAAMGAISTYISDNPAVIALARDKNFIEYFKEYQKPAITNFGTSFGMGLIVTAFMMSLGYFKEALIGNLGAVFGSIISTRLMLYFTKKVIKPDQFEADKHQLDPKDILRYREIREGNIFQRLLSSVLEGGQSGLEMGLKIIPGILVICTLVLMITFDSQGQYNGSAYQGIPILPLIGKWIYPALKLLFGFSSPDAIAFPITSLGAVGAAMALVPKFLSEGIIRSNEIAVFTSMGMCWSGYLSTHIAMMDALGYRKLTSKAILAHTIGGIGAGIFSHYLIVIIALF